MTLKIRQLIPDSTSDGKAPAVHYKPGKDFGKGQVGDNKVAQRQTNFSCYESNIRRNMAPKAASSVIDNLIYGSSVLHRRRRGLTTSEESPCHDKTGPKQNQARGLRHDRFVQAKV